MSNYGYPGSDDGGSYSYPTSAGGYGYPSAPQTDGSVQPQNLSWEMSKRGKIGRGSGGYYNLANWGWRVCAALIDYGPLFLLTYVASQIGVAAENLAVLVCVVLAVGNSIVLQGLTAQSVGKKVLGQQLVRGVRTDQNETLIVRPGVLWAFIRMISHALDAICYIGFFAPLFTARRQTFADMIANTVVLKEPRPIELSFAPPGARRTELR